MAERLNLVFDLDGTLIDSARQIEDSANKVFLANGLAAFPQGVVRGFIGNGVKTLVGRLMAYQGLSPDAALQTDIVRDFIRIYEEAFDLTTLYPSAADALMALSATGHRLAICTNKPEGPSRAILRHFGLAKLFPVVIGGDTLPQHKPDPAPLLAALGALGAGKALFVGDSEVDADTAHAAGIPLALFTGGYRKSEPDRLGAKLIFDDHAALPRLIAHLLPRLQAAKSA
ncbi:MAG: phosphoglycolate phosphatase [Tabrizicola sp.]|nr:phosphoglycolate phosphatase [Tabrizicola sp.]